jgi:hypothetical protein
MKPANDTRGETKYGARIIAFFLLGGGLLCMLGSAMTVYHSVQQHRALAGVSGMPSTALFACLYPPVLHFEKDARGF